ncbi:MAG: hypothetical protein K6D59_04210 [Bacteroidales bacterium]|nr:hypothetical protein [Bacteroidales bacterium]
MVCYIRIEEYVTLCQQAMKKNTPLEQIEALKRTRKIIRDDLMDHFTYGGLSNNWVQWWWNAVVSVYCEFRNTTLAEMDLYKKIDYDHFMEWVDFLDKSETRYKDVRQERDLLPDLEKRHPKLFEPDHESFPLLPNEEKPTVTTLDMVFYELLRLWQYSIWRLSRLAAVDGQVENPEDILSPREYMEYQSINDLRTRTQTSQDKRTSAFKKAVQETNEELYPDVDYDPVQGLDEDFYPDYENDDDYKKVDLPPEEVETLVIHEFEARKVTPLSELPAKLDYYFNTAWKILGIDDEGKKYQALGKFYDDIDKENGGYIDGTPQLPFDEIESSKLAEKLRLIEPSGKRRETDVLKDYLQRVEKLINKGTDVTNIGGGVTIIEGWDWNPVEGKYPAVVILEWLMIKIRKEMRNLHRQASYFEDIPKHKFIVHGHWDFIVNDDETADWVYIEEQKYVTDDDLDPSPLPEWITGKTGSKEPVSNVDNIKVPVTPSKEVKGNNTPDKTEENVLPVICETLTSKYNGQKLLIVYKNLTDKEYLFCTEDAWLYVWGVKVHPTKKTEIKAPMELPRWSAMQGKKTAIGNMIRTLLAKDCGKHWKKTAKLFLFSDGSQPVEMYLKNYGLKGTSKTEFLKLVKMH